MLMLIEMILVTVGHISKNSWFDKKAYQIHCKRVCLLKEWADDFCPIYEYEGSRQEYWKEIKRTRLLQNIFLVAATIFSIIVLSQIDWVAKL